MVTPDMFEGRMIRWGAYGDPAVLPAYLVEACNDKARGWTGYTHQYKYKWAQWAKGVFMASVETPKQEETLFEKGWGTFRAGLKDSSDKGSATLCLNEKTGITCLECKVCDGRHKRIFIPSHGRGASMVPAEKLLRRKEK
jgi:hypothetical protein